jgi:hypothetical protein
VFHGGESPPRVLIAGDGTIEDRWIGEHVVTAETRDDRVANRLLDAHERKHPPQGSDVRVGTIRTVPLVEAAVDTVAIVREPQLGDKPGNPTKSGVLSRLSARNTA